MASSSTDPNTTGGEEKRGKHSPRLPTAKPASEHYMGRPVQSSLKKVKHQAKKHKRRNKKDKKTRKGGDAGQT